MQTGEKKGGEGEKKKMSLRLLFADPEPFTQKSTLRQGNRVTAKARPAPTTPIGMDPRVETPPSSDPARHSPIQRGGGVFDFAVLSEGGITLLQAATIVSITRDEQELSEPENNRLSRSAC